MVPTAAAHYLEHITNFEMPEGLKRYMELELFPRIQLKLSKGISLATAHCLLRREWFQFQNHLACQGFCHPQYSVCLTHIDNRYKHMPNKDK